MKKYGLALYSILWLFLACESGQKEKAIDQSEPVVQANSLSGEPLYAPKLSEERSKLLTDNLNAAEAAFAQEPNEMNTIWLGRRHAYLTNYKKAIEVYTEGLKNFPNSYKLYRHRGHRYISTRQFDKALDDFRKAFQLMPKDTMEIEPDGIPNRLNQPLSNTQFNVLYHYGLAYYLKGEFTKATATYVLCREYSNNPDLLVATTDWLYMSLRRQGLEEQARELLDTDTITDDLEIIENDSYYKRLMMYKGQLPMEELFKTDAEDAALSLATQGYGVANWYLYNGDTIKAREVYQQILSGNSWSPFGYIAAEADMLSIH